MQKMARLEKQVLSDGTIHSNIIVRETEDEKADIVRIGCLNEKQANELIEHIENMACWIEII